MPPQPPTDVLVVGAGIVGICSALSLAEQGRTVTVVDKDGPAEGASHGNAGVISPWSCVPQSLPGLWKHIPKWLLDPEGPVALRCGYAVRFLPWALKFLAAGRAERIPAIADGMNALNRPNVDLYRRHLDGTGAEDLVADSWYVHLYRRAADADLGALAWRLRQERGVPLEKIGPGQLHEMEPDLAPRYEAAILIKDQARALSPGRIGKVLAEKAARMGVEFRRAAVSRLRPMADGGWAADTDAGEIVGRQLVLAAGAWSARLLEPLGMRLPLEAERGYHLIFTDPGVSLNNSIMEVDAKFVASSMETGIRAAGTAEFAGLDAPPDYRRARVLAKLMKRMLPGLNTEDTVEWMGARPSFPDSLPCIGEVPGQAGLFAAFGHSHYGFGMAPNTGRVVAQLVAGQPPNIDLTPYRVDRFD